MPEYNVGPFGRMLPANDNSSTEQAPEIQANRSESGQLQYPLPPPRPTGPLQFGTDPTLRQYQKDGTVDLRRGTAPAETASQQQQLPSVRHLLTPVTGPNPPPPSVYHPSYGTPTPGLDARKSSYPYLQHDSGLTPQLAPVIVQDRAKGHSELFPQSHTAALPSLSQMAMRSSPGDVKRHAATRSDASTTSFQNSPLSYPGAIYNGQISSGDISSPESTNRSKGSSILAHVVDERYIEGEGICYVYADGSHVPKSIGGIPVNANWGITKAGKPRKRLAQACLTCREKKIKCQPNLPKCDQCQKSGRECRFETAARGSRPSHKGPHSIGFPGRYDTKEGCSPGAPTTSEDSPLLYNLPRASNSATSLFGTSGHSPMSEGISLTPTGTEGTYESQPATDRVYQSRIYGASRPCGTDDTLPQTLERPDTERAPAYAHVFGELMELKSDDSLAGSWNADPFESDSEATTHYIESYFSHINDGLYHIFPRARFILWMKSCRTKSAEDRMLLYSMLTLGSIFSDRQDRIIALKRYFRIARYAIQQSQHTLSLQLAQSHIIMSLSYYATGSQVGSWDSIGAAVRAVSGLRYNVESGGVIVETIHECDYGLHPQALIECRRRTFWVAFTLDRVSAFLSASSIFISSETALIRLPCRDDIYEGQQYVTTPYLQSVLNQAEDDRSALSPTAFLIQIMSLWGDVNLHVFRLAHTPSETYTQIAEELHNTMTHKIDDWLKKIPGHLAFSAPNLEQTSQTKNGDAFASIHMFYHATLMKLYRHVRSSSMRSEVLAQYIHRARYHAVEILRIALAVIHHANQGQTARTNADNPALGLACLNPFLGYVVLSAIDVLSAAGLIAELQDCITFARGALGMLHILGRYWDSSLELISAIQRRLNLMVDCARNRSQIQDKTGFALDGPSLESRVHTGTLNSNPTALLEEDLFYGSMPREMLLHSMHVDDVTITAQRIAWLRDC